MLKITNNSQSLQITYPTKSILKIDEQIHMLPKNTHKFQP